MDDLSRNVGNGEAISAERPSALGTPTTIVCLNFKVPLRVRQQFKICAARSNLTMTELLLRLLDASLTLDAQDQRNGHSQIKK
jgi:hypothetical protein